MFVVTGRYCTCSHSCIYYSTAEELIVLFHLTPQALQSRVNAPAGSVALCQTLSVLFHEAVTNKASVIDAFVYFSAG